MTVGPIYGGLSEPVHFLLETTGENVVRAFPRLFYKYRAIEKLAEGRDVAAALLLAERFNAAQAFTHSFAFCTAIETMGGIEAPDRALGLRVILAELERLRSHVGTIRAICGSTALAVAESRAAYLEEELLRTSGAFCGHRYLFGLNVPGGLAADIPNESCRALVGRLSETERSLRKLERMLGTTSSFLDRLGEVGTVTARQATEHGLVGPVARASGAVCDLRKAHPYAGYERYTFPVASEEEGDGYARLRVFFFEAFQAINIMRQAADRLASGAVLAQGERQPHGEEVAFDPRLCIHCFRCARGVETPMGWNEGYEWTASAPGRSPEEAHVEGGQTLAAPFRCSLNILIVDAGDCGACLNEVRQLNAPQYNIHRLGFFITPRPRNADLLLVVGPVTAAMRHPLLSAYTAMPAPKRVLAVGACALSGTVFGPSFATGSGVGGLLPVDLEVPGSPPPPLAIMHALLAAARGD